jgi:hypothetical protein
MQRCVCSFFCNYEYSHRKMCGLKIAATVLKFSCYNKLQKPDCVFYGQASRIGR